MTPKLIIFDMDGTILNTIDDLADATNFALKKFSFPQKTLEEIKWLVGRGVQKLVKDALPPNTSDEIFEKVFEVFMNYYSEHSADKTCAYEGIIELLKSLKEKKFLLAVNSNKPDKEAGILAQKYFPDLFNFVLGNRPEIEKKPNPDGVFFICHKFNIPVSEAIYVGDSDIDLQTALNAEINFIGADWGFRGKKFLLEHGAKIVAMKPSEILELI